MKMNMLKRKMNKKGIFYSLSVLLFLIFLVIVFNNKSQVLKKDEEFHVDRAKILVMEHFVRDFDRYYAQNILETAARPALINLTANGIFSQSELIDLMQDGVNGSNRINPLLTTDENFNQSLATLSFQLDKKDFTYTLARITQINYTSLRLDFSVDYFFSAFDINWSRTGMDVSIILPVYGLTHPAYGEIIASDWVENNAPTAGCYVNQIINPPPDSACSGMNIMPPAFCGDNSVNQASEECDPPDGTTCDANCKIIAVTP